jgi:hypothetical protein
MKPYSTGAKLGALVVLTLGLSFGSSQEGIPGNEGFEVQARGPLHEAFAEPSELKPRKSTIVPKQPPPPIEEVPPEQKPEGTNVQWIGGYWAWDEDAGDYLWVSGLWRDIPPGRTWVPGYWTRLADGWVWVPGYWPEADRNEQQYLPEPPDSLEIGPSVLAPADDYSWVPGCWVWRDTRYLWRPGYWLRYHPGWCWTPAHYVWTPAGCVYVSGYWDYPLHCRGLLFAPVQFYRPLWTTAGWYWRPRYAVYPNFLYGALFVRPGYSSYYFGDYFGPRYAGLGYTPWINYRVGPYAADPLFSYYQQYYRPEGRWENNLLALYAGRGAGRAPLPPRTLGQQAAIAKDFRDPDTVRSLTALAALPQIDPSVARLQNVPEARQKEQREFIQKFRSVGQERQNLETQLAGTNPPTKGAAAPRTGRLDLPKLTPPAAAGKSTAPGTGGITASPAPTNLPKTGAALPSGKLTETRPGQSRPTETRPVPLVKPGDIPPKPAVASPAPPGKSIDAPQTGKQPAVPFVKPAENKPLPAIKPLESKPLPTPPTPSGIKPASPAPPVRSLSPSVPKPLESRPLVQPPTPSAPPSIRPPTPAPSAPPSIRPPTPSAPPSIRPSPPPVRSAAPPPAPSRPSASPPAPSRPAPAPSRPAQPPQGKGKNR